MSELYISTGQWFYCTRKKLNISTGMSRSMQISFLHTAELGKNVRHNISVLYTVYSNGIITHFDRNTKQISSIQ